MKYIVEKSLSDFKFWGGAKYNAEQFTNEELDIIGERLEGDVFATTPTETQINDLFWFDMESVASIVGLHVNEDGNIIRE